MTNSRHLAILKEGADVWNEWRKNSTRETPDLRYADLAFADLIGADLVTADFTGAVLIKADLSRANLRGAILSGTNLTRSKLTGACLEEAQLVNTNLTYANLSSANLNRALLVESVFFATDLTGARGLESCWHRGPCVVDHRTLLRSEDLPVAFLRGCGLPNDVIDIIPALRGSIIDHYSVFISHSSKDRLFVERLHADLQYKGVRCWLDTQDLKIGDRYRRVIFDAIRTREKLLVILSENSVGSTWVEDEVQEAEEQERIERRDILFPVRIDNAVMEDGRQWVKELRDRRHIGDFRAWTDPAAYGAALERLLRDLRRERGEGPASSGEG